MKNHTMIQDMNRLKTTFITLLQKSPSLLKSLCSNAFELTNIKITPLKGLSNDCYKINYLGYEVLAKPINPAKASLGITTKQEIMALKKVSHLPYAPKILAITQDWLFLKWIHGCSLDANASFDINNEFITQMAHIVKMTHRCQLSSHTIELKSLLNQLFTQISPSRYNFKLFQFHTNLLKQNYPTKSHSVFDHMDLHLGNILTSQDKLFVIDWEYSGNIEKHFALCNLFNALNLSYPQKLLFLQNYYSYSTHPDIIKKINLKERLEEIDKWQVWYDYLIYLWYEVRWSQTQDLHYLQYLNQHCIYQKAL